MKRATFIIGIICAAYSFGAGFAWVIFDYAVPVAHPYFFWVMILGIAYVRLSHWYIYESGRR